MSGHSKWSSIKHKKGAADAKRGKLFSKLSRAIIVAAREGGADPDANATLATAIQKARDNSMPKDTIERAIARGAGAGSDDDAAYETVTYEGYGPTGVAVFVEALTDNRNRTASEVRHVFTKNDGNLGTSGAVAWLFERKGVVILADSVDEDDLMLAAAEGGAEDIRHEGSSFEIVCAPEDLASVRTALDEAGIAYESAELTMLPKTTVAIADEPTAKKLLRLMDALEENDDVQAVYANFDIPEGILEAVAA
jgi:YebC/PmpR family DNA-binding regulatory protein